jgi:Tol biopolymer transport system component
MAGQVNEFGPAVPRTGLSRRFDFDWSPDASTIAVADGDKVWLVPTNGDDARTLPVAGAWSVRWSPDGRRLAVTVGPDVLIVTTDGRPVATVIDGDGEGPAPSWAWSPDGQWLAYVDGTKVVRVRADASATEARPIGVPEDADPQGSLVGWSPAGDRFLVSVGSGFREPVTLLSVPVDPREPAVVLVKPDDDYFGGGVSWQAAFD